MASASAELDEQTVFVENLPFDFTHDKLEAAFGDIGPVRECYVVGVPCRGIGFVKYALPTDARAAIELLHGKEVGGRKLRVSFSKRKDASRRDRAAREIGKGAAAAGCGRKPGPRASGEVARGRSRLIVRNLAWKVDEAALRTLFSAHGGVSEVVLPRTADGKGRGFAFVEMTSHAECADAIGSLNLAQLHSRPIAVDFAVAKDRYQAATVVGGGASDAAAATLGASAQPAAATVAQSAPGATAPLVAKRAAKAPGHRPSSAAAEAAAVVTTKAIKLAAEPPVDANEVSGQEEGEEESGQEEEAGAAKNDDDDDDEASAERGFTEEAGEAAADAMDEQGEESGEGADARVETRTLRRDGVPRAATPAGADELRRTAFVQNLSFEATADELKQALGASHGKVVSALLVTDKVTGLSRGSAFVRFASERSAAAACEESARATVGAEGEGIWLRGRQLRVLPAVDRSRASALIDENARERLASKKEGDSTHGKHAELASLGVLFPNAPEAASFAPAELRRHEQAWAKKKAKLKSPHFVVCKTRLSVRNVPWAMSETALGEIFLAAAQQAAMAGECEGAKAAPVLKHAKLVLEQSAGGAVDAAVGGGGGGAAPAAKPSRSAGFGFVEFAEHAHALAALRRLAFNAQALAVGGKPPPKRGLFVEFALDDTRKLELQRQRRERARARSRGGGMGDAESGQLAARWQIAAPDGAMRAGASRGAHSALGRGRGGARDAGRGRGGGRGSGGAGADGALAVAAVEPRADAPHGGRSRGGGRGAMASGQVRGVREQAEAETRGAPSPRATPTPAGSRGAKRPGPHAQQPRAGAEPVPERARKVRKASEAADDRAFDSLVARHKSTLASAASGLRDWMEL